jgi:hypothetical protein
MFLEPSELPDGFRFLPFFRKGKKYHVNLVNPVKKIRRCMTS